MAFIEKLTARFIESQFDYIESGEPFINKARAESNSIDAKADRIRFLAGLLEEIHRLYDEHKLECTSPHDCRENFAYENAQYFLTQELGRLDVVIDKDAFTTEEKVDALAKLDRILNELEQLKCGQEIIAADLEELRTLIYLGKKKWYRQVFGTIGSWTAAGMISETVSKGLLSELQTGFIQWLGS